MLTADQAKAIQDRAETYERMADHASGIGAYRAAEFYFRKAVALRKGLSSGNA